MKTITKALLHLGVVTTMVAGLSGTALAQHRRGDGGYGTISGQFNYGIWTGESTNGVDLNAFGPGLGVRGGYTLDMGLYIGADFDYFFGESQGGGGGVAGIATATATASANVYDFMAEIGYDFWIYDHGVLRPKLGLGVGFEHGSVCANVNAIIIGSAGGCAVSDTRSGFAFAPGLQFFHVFDTVFLTAELRYQHVVISDIPDPSAIVLGIGVGAKF